MLTDLIPLCPEYAATEQIYVGAHSTVYRGRRVVDGEPVILKIANTGHATFGESLTLLRRELELLASIRSDRVIRGLDVTMFGSDAMLVVQDIGGESLDRYLARARLSLADALGLALGICAALRDVHAAGIIHRDIAPDNIVFNASTGEARLIDFDIATARRADHDGLMSPRSLEGTLRYMAPEQTGRMNRDIDSRADLYALGVTLFEMLTGRLPFTETDPLSIVHAHLAIVPPAPDTIDPAIPGPVSAIVMKLLAKAPEDRYQTAEGLLADLRTCVVRYAATATIAAFPLGCHDVTERFELPARLHGRAAELAVLSQAFERASAGAAEIVRVTGPSGIGKTSVVRALFPLITRRRGYLLSGQFDQLRGDTPYPTLVAAFDELILHLRAEGEDERARWADRITAAIAPDAQLVLDAIPALERIIGSPSAAAVLDPAEAERRLPAALQRLLQVFTRRAHPLVVFLDDMQWADPESLQLIDQVARSEQTEALLVIEAFRDAELPDDHPLAAAVRERGAHRQVTRLALAPLAMTELASIVAEALRRDVASVGPLARLVNRKTGGNPLLVRQLLLALHGAGQIVFDPAHRWFSFDPASIEDAPLSNGVAELRADGPRTPAASRLPAGREQLQAHIMLAECRYHSGDIKGALGALDAAAAAAAHHRDHATLEALRATFHLHANHLKAAIRHTRRAAALFGRELPEAPGELGRALEAAIATITARIGEGAIEDLIELPAMTDLDALALMTLFRNCVPAAFQVEPALGAYLAAQMVELSLAHGNCPASAHAYAWFASVLHATEGRPRSYRFGTLGVALNQRLDDRAARPAVALAFALFSASWNRPLAEAIGTLREATHAARELGDHIDAGAAAANEIAFRVFQGAEPFAELCRDAQIYQRQCREVGDVACARLITWQIDRLRVLMGEISAVGADDPDSQISLNATRDEANAAHQFSFLMMLVDTTYSTGDESTALDLATATRLLEAALPPVVTIVEHQFYHCLAAIAVCRQRPARRAELAPVIEANQQALGRWVAGCPANFEAMYLLVEAERAALTGALETTLALYDRATAAAARDGRRRLEALASELHGRFWIHRGKPEIAHLYLARARTLYAALGAQRKVRMLERAHPGLTRATPAAAPSEALTAITVSEVLDVAALARATRALSEALELDALLEIALEILFEHTGAEGGALVLETARGPTVAASRTAGALRSSPAGVALPEATLPHALVHHVRRTGATVVLDGATQPSRFASDDYLRMRKPRSVLCTPVKHKDRVIGVLYLEHTLTSGVFTRPRLDALTLLIPQLAVSLDNAARFAAQRVQAEAIARANDELRGELAVRDHAAQELIAQREQREAELRIVRKLAPVGRLAAGIAHELSTPVQYVSDSLTFLHEAMPNLIDALGKYRELAATADPDLDYTLAHGPAALETALAGLGRVSAIVGAMKDFAHLDRDGFALVDLNRAIESTLILAANDCKYVADVHTELAELPLVRCNAGEIKQAVLTLVLNAAHAIRGVVDQAGGRGTIDVRTRRDGQDIEISIRDTGAGSAPAARDTRYAPCLTIADKHGGSLRFAAEAGAGTTCLLRLPIGDAIASAA